MKKHQQKLKATSLKLKQERIDASLPSDYYYYYYWQYTTSDCSVKLKATVRRERG